jgi:hypothetical protein
MLFSLLNSELNAKLPSWYNHQENKASVVYFKRKFKFNVEIAN